MYIQIYIIKRNLEPSLVRNNGNGLKVTAEKTQFMSWSVGRQNRNMMGNQLFNGKEYFKYLGQPQTNHKEIKSRLNPVHACYQSVQNLMSSSLLYK